MERSDSQCAKSAPVNGQAAAQGGSAEEAFPNATRWRGELVNSLGPGEEKCLRVPLPLAGRAERNRDGWM